MNEVTLPVTVTAIRASVTQQVEKIAPGPISTLVPKRNIGSAV